MKNFEEALEIGDNQPQIHYYYAKVLAEEGRNQKSRSQLRKVIEMKPRDEMLIEDRRTIFKARQFIEELST